MAAAATSASSSPTTLGVPAEREVGVDRVHARCDTPVLELLDLDPGEGLERETGENRSPPERERLAEEAGGCAGVPGHRALTGLGEEALEPPEVDLLRLGMNHIAGRARLDRVCLGPEGLPQLGHVQLDRLRCRRRWRLPPQLLDQPVYRHDLVRVDQEHGEHGSGLGGAERDLTALEQHLERAEDAVLHGSLLPPRGRKGKLPTAALTGPCRDHDAALPPPPILRGDGAARPSPESDSEGGARHERNTSHRREDTRPHGPRIVARAGCGRGSGCDGPPTYGLCGGRRRRAGEGPALGEHRRLSARPSADQQRAHAGRAGEGPALGEHRRLSARPSADQQRAHAGRAG